MGVAHSEIVIMEDDDERATLISSATAGAYSQATDDTGIDVADVYAETRKDGRLGRRWISIYIMYFTMLIGAITFSIVISSLFPFLQKITENQTSTLMFGLVIAGYSLGQLIASPIFGFWSDKRPTKEPLIVSLVLSIVTNILYCYTQAFPSSVSQYVMMVARGLVGFGAGNAAVARSYVSAATTESERVGAFAGISASQAMGFILGPVLALAFVPLRDSGFEKSPYFFFNMYTGPGYLSAVLALINVLLVVFLFKENRLVRQNQQKMKPIDKSQNSRSAVFSINSGETAHGDGSFPKYDRLGAFICVVLFFAILFAFAVFETIVTPYSMDEFGWSKQKGVLYNNIMFGMLAVLAIVAFIGLKFVTKYVDDRVVFMCGLFITALGFFAMIPMSDELPDVGIQFIENNTSQWVSLDNSSLIPLSSATIPAGCRYPKLQWCLTIPKMELYQYVMGMVLLAVGYPVSSVLCYSLFSKILGPHPQGIMMGVLTGAGSLARIVGPIFVTFLYDVKGPVITLSSIIGVLAMAICLLTCSCYRLVPFRTHKGCPSVLRRRDVEMKH